MHVLDAEAFSEQLSFLVNQHPTLLVTQLYNSQSQKRPSRQSLPPLPQSAAQQASIRAELSCSRRGCGLPNSPQPHKGYVLTFASDQVGPH